MSYWTKRRKLRTEIHHILGELQEAKDNGNTSCESTVTVRQIIQSPPPRPSSPVTLSTIELHQTAVEQTNEVHHMPKLHGDANSDFLPCFDNESAENLTDVEYDESESDVDSVSDSEVLKAALAAWACKNKVTQTSLGDLLHVPIIRKHFPDLPKSAATVMQTGKIRRTHTIVGNTYCYFGIKTELLSFRNVEMLRNRTFSIQVNIDGLPLFKSSSVQFWPILGLIEQFDGVLQINREPFVIALYCDSSKPKNINKYFADFVQELNELKEQGVLINGYRYEVRLSALVCDTPARAFVKCVRGHGAYHGCDKCEQHGEYAGRVIYPETAAALRTDASFALMSDKQHHIEQSPLAQISIGMVSQVPADYMHLVCLGNVRKLVFMWLKGPLKTRLGPRVILSLSEKLLELRPHICSEFVRRPRSFSEFERWKATEFRQLLLYTGMVCLRDILSEPLYNNFMLLNVAITILISESLCMKYVDYANSLLVIFVKHVASIYGKEFLTYNMHGLVHLAQDAKRFGPLDNFSSFPFENFLAQLKQLVRKPHLPLQQVVLRLSEMKVAKCNVVKEKSDCVDSFRLLKEHRDGPLCTGNVCSQYRELLTERFCIKLTDGDNCLRLKCGAIVVAKNIVKTRDSQIFILYNVFQNVENFFTYPCNSKDVDIFMVSQLATTLSVSRLIDIKGKYVLLPYKDSFAAVPLLHCV